MNETTNNEQPTEIADPVEELVMRDIKSCMIKLTEKRPIVNSGSFAMTLLWQIFEAASDDFEEWEALASYNDEDIEACLKTMFPVFIAKYPEVMVLDA